MEVECIELWGEKLDLTVLEKGKLLFNLVNSKPKIFNDLSTTVVTKSNVNCKNVYVLTKLS